MDVATHLDPEIATLLASSPLGEFDFGTVDLSGIPALRETLARMPRPAAPADDDGA
jgi:hypothetical protein